jgi:hypothetical protein
MIFNGTASVSRASAKRLQIGMDVRQQRNFHKAIFQ